MKIFFCYIIIAVSVFANQRVYFEEGNTRSRQINFASILNETEFPFHPSKQEIQDAKIKGAMADINILVVDEAKNPVENAKVSISFKMDSLGYTGVPNNNFTALTDSKGKVHASEKCDGEIVLDVAKKDWYYSGLTTMLFFNSKKNYSLQNGKWQP